jgi:hypothetical protein
MEKRRKKQNLGQFYTTNYQYILQGMSIPPTTTRIIEPFAGNGDLFPFAKGVEIEAYDIDPKKPTIQQRDTLLNPPDYTDAFVLTNPPYLARNKSGDKTVLDEYNQNDLYKCFIYQLTLTPCAGGIIIIPLNFWCSIRKSDIQLRSSFLTTYKVLRVNIFEERVFEDTTYTICSIHFQRMKNDDAKICCMIYPQNKQIEFDLRYQSTIGGEIYTLPQDGGWKIDRLTTKNKDSEYATNILVKCIDDSATNKIALSFSEKYVDETPNLSARSYATLVIEPKLSEPQQRELVERFNVFLNERREKYQSLFLTNYRESNSIARKRISFQLVFEIANYLLSHR